MSTETQPKFSAEPTDSCPACGSESCAECWYVPGMTGMPVTCGSDWHDDDARGPGDHPVPAGFPFPLAEPRPAPVMISRPCGCTSMDAGEGDPPMQVSWCVGHDPGYTPPGGAQ